MVNTLTIVAIACASEEDSVASPALRVGIFPSEKRRCQRPLTKDKRYEQAYL